MIPLGLMNVKNEKVWWLCQFDDSVPVSETSTPC